MQTLRDNVATVVHQPEASDPWASKSCSRLGGLGCQVPDLGQRQLMPREDLAAQGVEMPKGLQRYHRVVGRYCQNFWRVFGTWKLYDDF